MVASVTALVLVAGAAAAIGFRRRILHQVSQCLSPSAGSVSSSEMQPLVGTPIATITDGGEVAPESQPPSSGKKVRVHRPLQVKSTPQHVVLQPPQLKSRVVIVGDVHGCYDELKLLLDKCGVDDDTTVIFVGDIVNKGPHSARVVALARSLGAWSVRGNHDHSVLKEFHKAGWESKKYDFMQDFCEEDIEYLERMPFTISLPSLNSIVVHAGLVPGRALHDLAVDDMTRMRNLHRVGDGRLLAVEKGGMGQAWASVWPGPAHVFFGHDAKRGIQMHPFATGLDSGCLYGRKLTACILPERKIVQVDALRVYVAPNSPS